MIFDRTTFRYWKKKRFCGTGKFLFLFLHLRRVCIWARQKAINLRKLTLDSTIILGHYLKPPRHFFPSCLTLGTPRHYLDSMRMSNWMCLVQRFSDVKVPNQNNTGCTLCYILRWTDTRRNLKILKYPHTNLAWLELHKAQPFLETKCDLSCWARLSSRQAPNSFMRIETLTWGIPVVLVKAEISLWIMCFLPIPFLVRTKISFPLRYLATSSHSP